MILILYNSKDNPWLHSELSKHYSVMSVEKKVFNISMIQHNTADLIILNSETIERNDLKLIEEIAEKFKNISLLVCAHQFTDRITKFPQIEYISKDAGDLSRKILDILSRRDVDWDRMIQEIINYIESAEPPIHRVEHIALRFRVSKRELFRQFYVRKQKGLKKFIEIRLMDSIRTSILSEGRDVKAIAVALRCGFKNDACLEVFLKRMQKMTFTEFRNCLFYQ